jgi:hypothetical protein
MEFQRLTKKKIGSLAAILAPIICFYTILVHHLINLPLEDDYETVLPFMARFSTMDWPHRLGLIFHYPAINGSCTCARGSAAGQHSPVK